MLRRQLAAAYRVVDYFGWTELIYGHLTARVPGDKPHFLINPFGLNYDEVTASNLVKIDVDGNPIGEANHPVNYAGFVIHSAIHMAHQARQSRGDAHPHPRRHGGRRHQRRTAADLDERHGVPRQSRLSRLRGVSLELDERSRLVHDLGDRTAMMLRNHGLLTTGRSVAEALIRLYRLERACQTQIDAGAAGTISVMGDNVAGKSRSQLDGFGDENTGSGDLEFAALIRKIDKIDTSWRH